jgi:hypothetical protein
MKCSFCRLLTLFAVAVTSIAAQTPDIASLQHNAEAGDAKAQFELARAYSLGNGVPQDMAKALDWLKKSASQGYAGAEVTLGVFYQKGIQVAKDPHEAAKWFRKAARQSAKEPGQAQNAQSDLENLLVEGAISTKEYDWRTPEPGSEPTQAGKTTEPKPEPKNKTSQPFSLSEVETGLTGGITPKRMTTLVGQYGVDFSLNDSAKQRLTNDGADDTLLQTIASSKR